MKIIVASTTFPPQANGVSHIAWAQAVELARRGHEVTVATDNDPDRRIQTFSEFQVRQFNVWGSANWRRGHHGDIASYQEFIANHPADIILCNCWQNWATDLAAPAFSRTRARTVIVSQGFDAHLVPWFPGRSFGLVQWAGWQPYVWRFPKLMRAFDHVIFLAQRKDLKRFFDHWLAARMGRPAHSIVPNGVHLDEIREIRHNFRQLYRIPESDELLLDVANYCDRKNQVATLRAFLRARRQDATLVFIGSELGEYGERCQRLLREAPNPVGRVLFLERVPREHIYAAYQTADVFILTAKAETQPLAILDGMAVGIPYISTDVGCVTEMPGGLIVRGDEETAEAINRLLDDPGLARRLGEEGRLAVEARFSWKQVASEYEKVFEQLLAKRA